MHKKIIYLFLSVLILQSLLSCAQMSKKNKAQTSNVSNTNFNSLKENQITFYGQNSQASFSPDGKKIVFTSSHRGEHKNSQVYLLNIESMHEKRVTFQDGSAVSPVVNNDGQTFIYASTTDEIKESPLFIYNNINTEIKNSKRGVASVHIHQGSDLYPYELYQSSLDGEDVIRLTHSPNLDRNISRYQHRHQRLFTSVRDGNLEIYRYRPHRPSFPLRVTDSQLMDDEAQYSPIGDDYIWVRYSQNFKYSQILQASKKKEMKEISFGPYFHINPKWHPDGEFIYFSANGKNHKNFQIYAMKKDGSCKKRLTFNEFSDTYPAVDPQKKYLVFTRESEGKKHLYKTKLELPSCNS